MATLDEAEARYVRGLVLGVYRCGEDLLGKAQNEAPIEEGTLRGSAELALLVNGVRYVGPGMLEEATIAAVALARAGDKLTVEAEVSFNTVYAARQHEELDYEHPLGGRAKYLEAPLRDNADRYAGVIATAGRASL